MPKNNLQRQEAKRKGSLRGAKRLLRMLIERMARRTEIRNVPLLIKNPLTITPKSGSGNEGNTGDYRNVKQRVWRFEQDQTNEIESNNKASSNASYR